MHKTSENHIHNNALIAVDLSIFNCSVSKQQLER